MTEKKILIPTIEAVRKFVTTVTMFVGDVDVLSGRYIVDAKSLMGLFSLDLASELTLRIHAPQSDFDCGNLLAKLDEFICKEG